MIQQSPATEQPRSRAPRALRITSIQFRRAGLRLSRLFTRSRPRDENDQTAISDRKAAARSSTQKRIAQEPEESRSRIAAVGVGARRTWRRFSLLPAQHRAWTFAAVTGTLGIVLLLCWQLFGGHATTDTTPATLVEEIASEEHAPATEPDVLNAPKANTRPETIADGVEDFAVGNRHKTAADPFGALPDNPHDSPPKHEPLQSTETNDTQPSPPEKTELTSDLPPVDKLLPAEKSLDTVAPASEPSAPKVAASSATKPDFDLGTSQGDQAAKPEDETGKLKTSAPEFPETPTKTPTSDAPVESPAPLTTDAVRAKVRDLLDGAANETKKPDWNRHEDAQPPEPQRTEPAEKIEEDPKPEVPIDRPRSKPILEDPPASKPAEPAETKHIEPAMTEPAGKEALPAKENFPAKESEPAFPDSPRIERAPTEAAPIEKAPTEERHDSPVPSSRPRSTITDSAVTNVASPQLDFMVLSPERVPLGGTCRVGFRVTNNGTVATEGVKVLFDLPAELSYHKGRALEYAVGTLAPGETREARLTARADTMGSGICRGIIQTSGERITDAEAKISISPAQPAGYPAPMLMTAPQFYGPPILYEPCPCGW